MYFLCIFWCFTQSQSISVDLVIEFEADFCVPETLCLLLISFQEITPIDTVVFYLFESCLQLNQ